MAKRKLAPLGRMTAMAAPTGRYDETNTKKVGIGVFVVLKNGRQYLFGDTGTWTWRHISGRLVLQVKEHGIIGMHAPFDSVACVGGPQVIFRDAEWK